MHSYLEVAQYLDNHVCTECSGSGKCDDLEPGDISGNEWTCTKCNGTGFENGQFSLHVIIDKPVKKCNHDWVSADNKVVTGGVICTKCHEIRAKDEI